MKIIPAQTEALRELWKNKVKPFNNGYMEKGLFEPHPLMSIDVRRQILVTKKSRKKGTLSGKTTEERKDFLGSLKT